MDLFGRKLSGPLSVDPKPSSIKIMSESFIGYSEYLIGIGLGAAVGIFTSIFISRFIFREDDSKTSTSEIESEYEFDDKKEYRMVLVVRNDLKMGKGKIAAQCCHAAVMAYDAVLKKRPYLLKPWKQNGTAKIAVKVESEDELLQLDKKAKSLKVLTRIVRDAGHTQVAPMSRTVLALGPAPKNILDKITGHLKLL
ncbi:hypothetical protein WA026_016694 [Henosepilachna vigintioctopunctata]|uniref:peptidyl-tRNA hydrolase n=1 Tax=Henosepilachna vigintioctopunctata TaxID=420089 RepID=A0AAW1V2G0_9CUCU